MIVNETDTEKFVSVSLCKSMSHKKSAKLKIILPRVCFCKRTANVQAGFTLIELLIAILLLGIVISLVIVGVDPIDKINLSNDAKVQTDIAILATAFESNATMFGAQYSSNLAFLVAVGDLKNIPTPPNGYCGGSYQLGAGGSSQSVWCNLKSKKYSSTPFWYWCSEDGQAHAVTTVPPCP